MSRAFFGRKFLEKSSSVDIFHPSYLYSVFNRHRFCNVRQNSIEGASAKSTNIVLHGETTIFVELTIKYSERSLVPERSTAFSGQLVFLIAESAWFQILTKLEKRLLPIVYSNHSQEWGLNEESSKLSSDTDPSSR